MRIPLWVGLVVGSSIWAATPSKVANYSFIYQRFANLESCGCDSVPLGGIEAERFFLNQKKTGWKGPWFHFSIGATLVPESFNPAEVKEANDKAFKVISALNSLDTSAYSVSALDFQLPCGTLKKLKSRSKFPWISTNFEGKRCAGLTKPYAILGQHVVLGLWTPADARSKELLAKYGEWKTLETVLNKHLSDPKLKGKTFVVLHNLSRSEVKVYSNRFPDVALWLGGVEGWDSAPFEFLGKSALALSVKDRGRVLGVVRLEGNGAFKNFYNVDYAERNAVYLKRAEEEKDTEAILRFSTFAKSGDAELTTFDYKTIPLDNRVLTP